METPTPPPVAALPFKQPKVGLRWLAVVLALVGWCVSLSLLMATVQGAPNPLLDTLCGGPGQHAAGWDCRSVLNSRYASVALTPDENALRIPVSAFGMGYFALVGLWYLLVGPPTRERRAYHFVITAIVLCGLWESVHFVLIMANELHQWCIGCLVTHAVNALLALLTLLAWPWSARPTPVQAHPSGRLALAALVAALLAAFTHLPIVFIVTTSGQMKQLRDAYVKIVEDPDYVLWNYRRQPVTDVPPRPDEIFLGTPAAPHTVVVFSDFQCPRCRQLHDRLAELVRVRPAELRVMYRHFPQDPACNPAPRFAAGGHPAACRVARACEAARLLGGADAANALRTRLYERQAQLDTAPLADWAAELGLDRSAFERAMESDAARDRVAEDVAEGTRLGVLAVPVVYLDGRRFDNWTNTKVWDALLGGESPPTAPTTRPTEP